MPDKKLTDVTDNKFGEMSDSEIVKALECCKYEYDTKCELCCYNFYSRTGCRSELRRNALDLINRLQAENENLKLDIATLEAKNFVKDKLLAKAEIKLEEAEDTIQFADKELKKAEAENERLKNCVKSEDEVRAIAKRTMEPLVKEITREQIDIAVKYAKAEAYKECIEKVKENANKCFASRNGVVLEETTTYNISKISLDNLLKELVGEDNSHNIDKQN